jgi:hypothetical protein
LTDADTARRALERENLRHIAVAARHGIETPDVQTAVGNTRLSVTVQSAVVGRPLVGWLQSRRLSPIDVFDLVAAWLERWHRASARPAQLTSKDLARALLSPAEELQPNLDQGRPYRAWLERRFAGLIQRPLSRVAVHNDLTMWNIFYAAPGRLSVIDWELAGTDALPLTDFYYAAVDAVAASDRYASRSAAFRTCFATESKIAHAVNQWRARLIHASGIDMHTADFCFHACWLHHAVNEQRLAAAHAPRPFLEIVQQLAATSIAQR